MTSVKKWLIVLVLPVVAIIFINNSMDTHGQEHKEEFYIVEALSKNDSDFSKGILDVSGVFDNESDKDNYVGHIEPDFSHIPFYYPEPDMLEKEVPFEEDRKYVAITFDDGPQDMLTELLLDGLLDRGVVATFFILGQRINGREDIIRRMHGEGHEIASHTENHKLLSSLRKNGIAYEMDTTTEKLKAITGEDVTLVRPPYGDRNNLVVDMIKERNQSIILWNIDPKDWEVQDANMIATHIEEIAKSGDIILLHDIYPTSIEAALTAIDKLTERGFMFVTVSELIGELEAGKVYRSAN